MRTLLYMMSLLALLSANTVLAEETAADARKHMVRGVAAIEMAKTNSELELAANEFGRATELDPGLSAAWFNLGSVQSKLGKYAQAISSYRRYLELVPNAEDAMKVEDEIIKLEFRQEQAAKVTSMVGTWLEPDGTPYRLNIKGNRFTLATDHHGVTEDEVVSTYTLVGSVPVFSNEQVVYRMERSGSALSGVWWHGAIKADKCKIPEETGEVTGEISADNSTIVLHYTRNKYRAATQMSILDDFCSSVEVTEKRKVEMVLKGPMGPGVTGLQLGMYDHVAEINVGEVAENTPLTLAGLQSKDRIVAVDGIPLSTLSPIEVWMKFRGPVDSEAVISVLRGAENEPVEIRVKRFATEQYQPKAGD
ncbi:MAG: tetratricopeptide repeat protein [Sideroxydans sp.]|nr:tetratricopeptide repeat protein [Sideroxydans sp.]